MNKIERKKNKNMDRLKNDGHDEKWNENTTAVAAAAIVTQPSSETKPNKKEKNNVEKNHHLIYSFRSWFHSVYMCYRRSHRRRRLLRIVFHHLFSTSICIMISFCDLTRYLTPSGSQGNKLSRYTVCFNQKKRKHMTNTVCSTHIDVRVSAHACMFTHKNYTQKITLFHSFHTRAHTHT